MSPSNRFPVVPGAPRIGCRNLDFRFKNEDAGQWIGLAIGELGTLELGFEIQELGFSIQELGTTKPERQSRTHVQFCIAREGLGFKVWVFGSG